ncbi:MAG: DUF1467 family protein [Alphaproteobacteria bacterium]|nr:MAG: DUF1467 family protein [Alphaproteobacteria bacterium]
MQTNWFIVLTSYFVVWWTVLFAVLPFWVERDPNPAQGHDPGAPKNAHIGRKFMVTSIVAAVIWAVLYYMGTHGAMDRMIEWIGTEP